MKTISLIAICGLFFCYLWLKDSPGKNGKLITTNKMPTDSIGFTLQVQLILQKNCSPCHFPGGKMYAKLPFDIPQTILSLKKDRVLMRIKDINEKELVMKFINQ